MKNQNKCIASVNGKCKSDYSPIKCDGINIPDDCSYALRKCKHNVYIQNCDICNSQKNVIKGDNLSLGNHLEARNIQGKKLQRNMPVHVDNQHSSDKEYQIENPENFDDEMTQVFEEEFNLSEKELEELYYLKSDVKEFIRLLKELSRKIKGQEGDWVNINTVIELAGDKLNGN